MGGWVGVSSSSVALRNAILASLADSEASGYDLAKLFDVAVANFWTCTPQQLYRELDRLEREGLVRGRVVKQQRRPNKRVFTLSAAGRTALRDFTAQPPKPTAIRDELLVQVHASDHGDLAAIESTLESRLADAEAKLERYERIRDHILAGRDEAEYLAAAPRVGPYLTLTRGIAYERENIAWMRNVLVALRRRAPRVSRPEAERRGS